MTALSAAIASEKAEKTAQRANQAPSLAAVQAVYSKNSPELLDYSKNKQEQVTLKHSVKNKYLPIKVRFLTAAPHAYHTPKVCVNVWTNVPL